jgi:photosystem II stability/assembly factor-like uncharacterized protein
VSWTKLNTVAYKGKQDDVHFVDAQHGWYGNGEGKLYRTTNGGDAWELAWNQPGTFIRAVGFADAKNGWVGNVGTDYYPGVTDPHPLYRTRNGGVTWDKVLAAGIEKISGICGIDVLHTQAIFQGELRPRVIVHAAGRVGGSAWLMRSTDGGETFSVIDMNPYCGMILDVKFLDANVGFVCAASNADTAEANAMMLRTTDGGKTWTTVYRSARLFENCWKMNWPKTNGKYGKTAYATVQNYDPAATKRVFIKTVDGGKTWVEGPLVDDAKVRQFGIGFVDAKRGWIGTTTGGYETRDGGKSWSQVEFGKAVNKIRVVPNGSGGHMLIAIGVDVHRANI